MSLRKGLRAHRRRRIAAAALTAASAIALSGCSTDLSPGAAAVVDGTTIEQNGVDDVVQAACHYLVLTNEGSTQPTRMSVSDMRAIILSSLVVFDVLENLTDDLGLTIHPADVEAFGGSVELPDGLTAGETDLMATFFEDQATAQVQQATIGANATDPEVTDSTGVTQDSITDAQEVLSDAFDAADVSVSPAFGEWTGSSVVYASGSLSEPVSDAAGVLAQSSASQDISSLPPSQVCG